MINPKYIKENLKLKKEIADIEIYLADREISAYADWKRKPENALDKSAKDKILAVLKDSDEEWLEKEGTLRLLKIRVSFQNLVIALLERMIPTLTAGVISLDYFREYEVDFKEYFKKE